MDYVAFDEQRTKETHDVTVAHIQHAAGASSEITSFPKKTKAVCRERTFLGGTELEKQEFFSIPEFKAFKQPVERAESQIPKTTPPATLLLQTRNGKAVQKIGKEWESRRSASSSSSLPP